ncbi:MAG: phosphatase PAP2 family protein [Bacteroidales bacterium]|jgi:undecaprenyl-diphosphatase
MDWLINLDKELFIYLNGCNSAFFDPIMIFFSKIWIWIPLYVAIITWIFIKKKWKIGLIALAAILICFGLSDQISVAIKNCVERLRPCEDPSLVSTVRLLEKSGGLYGFVSSHASNVFGLAILTSFIIKVNIYSYSIFSWASIVSYSRIYVGKHFPGDVICGIILGLIIGYTVFHIFKFVTRKFKNKKKPCTAL